MPDFTIEPDLPPRNGPHHKQIVATRPMPKTQTGKYITLECGHILMSFGDLSHTGGRVLCLECKKQDG